MKRGVDVSGVLPTLLAERGMTQEELANRTKIVRATVNGYCSGRLRLGADNARRIAAVLGVEPAVLMPPPPRSTVDLERQIDEQAKQIEALTQVVAKLTTDQRQPLELPKPGSRTLRNG